jgi:cell fate (sporulation/competence/biofilm development) regulator YlbF (YheA/YmcA/DUF963 family)
LIYSDPIIFDVFMKDILAKAQELGRLIKNTEIYRNFHRTHATLQKDTDAAALFKEYLRVSGMMKERQDTGDMIEKYEVEQYKILIDMVTANDLIMDYLNAQQKYLDLLVEIQNQIGDSEEDIISP